jgi:MFS family permease
LNTLQKRRQVIVLDRRKTQLLTGVLLAAALAPLGSTSIAVAMPLISQAVGMDPSTTTQLLVGGYLLIAVVGQIPAGKVGDLIGYQKALYTGLGVFLLGSTLGYALHHVETLLLARMLMAAGSALIVPNATALLRTELPESSLPFAYGVFGATMGAAASIGPLLGGSLTEWFGWPSIFLLNVPWVLIAFVLIVISSQKHTSKQTGRFDWRSSLLLAIAIACIQWGFVGELHIAFVASGCALLSLFIVLQLKTSNPVFNPRFFIDPVYSSAAFITAFNNFVMYALLFQLPLYFHDVHQITEIDIAAALTVMTVCMILGGPVSGFCVRFMGVRLTAVAAGLIGLLGLYFLSDLAAIQTPVQAMPALAVLGLSFGMVAPVAQTAGMLAIEKTDAGMAAGGLSTMRYVGGTIGISLLSLKLSGAGSTTLNQHLTVFPYFAGVLLLAVVASVLLPVSNKPSTD